MNYSEVDMTLDGGLGAVTGIKNVNLMPQSSEKVTAVVHANGQDIWVLGRPWNSNEFFAYSVTDLGLNTVPVRSATPITLTNFPAGSTGTNTSIGQLKISPKGDKIGMVTTLFGAHVFDFDNATGLVSNMVEVSSSTSLYGLEFSPSGKRLYITESPSGTWFQSLFQFNLEAPDIAASQTLIGYDPAIGYALQLAINGKIYGIPSSFQFLYSIENPDALGTACNYIYNSVDLNGRTALAGLPPLYNPFSI